MNTEAELKDSTVLYKADLFSFQREGVHVALDGQAPNWLATNERGIRLLSWADGRRTLGELRSLYAAAFAQDGGRAWRDVHVFAREALRRGFLSLEPVKASSYHGRSQALKREELKEFWLHLVQTCNLSCSHCLVSSSPKGERGPDMAFVLGIVDQAAELGAKRFYVTGGEPFVRPDLFELIEEVVDRRKAELIVMTNGTLIDAERLKRLDRFERARLKFQVSIDGATAAVNDAIRGAGVFDKACAGLKALSSAGFETSLTAAVTSENRSDLLALPELAERVGAKSLHLLWLHRRGRILETAGPGAFPGTIDLLALARKVYADAKARAIALDNMESLRLRVNGRPGVKYDLGNQGWESLCLYIDGRIYPSAAMAGIGALSFGDARSVPLKSLWLDSPVARLFEEATVAGKDALASSPFRFLTGGGDLEHSYFFSALSKDGDKGSLQASDPYHDLYVELIKDVMIEHGLAGKAAWNARTGFTPPPVYHAMGDGAVGCSEDAAAWLSDEAEPVRLLHSNCVLAFDVEKPYRAVQKFYGHAAEEPQKELCCPVKYDDSEVGHIPKDVLDRFYGCGSPMAQAQVRPGETTLDLGSGAGIDCFIAAKKVRPEGKVIGVDMTDRMLEVARRCKKDVARNLGYDVVEFREGFLEKVPAEDKSVDLVTSNCVINLSPDKGKVFAEIWRILKDHGRLVVADIVSERPVPLALQAHQDLWGECISGSLSEAEFFAGLERAGFYGLCLLKKTFWKEVEGVKFYSITVRGYKFEKKAGCKFIGQKAVYLGPFKAGLDEEGHLFPRGEAVEVCTDTAAKLANAPYAGQFTVLEPDGASAAVAAGDDCCSPGSGKCC